MIPPIIQDFMCFGTFDRIVSRRTYDHFLCYLMTKIIEESEWKAPKISDMTHEQFIQQINPIIDF